MEVKKLIDVKLINIASLVIIFTALPSYGYNPRERKSLKFLGGNSAEKVTKLRQELIGSLTGFDGYIVPSEDAHLNEYISPHDERRAWLTEFTGSAGTAYVTLEEAFLVTDGRYTLQAANQLDSETWKLNPDQAAEEKIWKNVSKVAACGLFFSDSAWNKLETHLSYFQVELVMIEYDFIDIIWTESRPTQFTEKMKTHDIQYAGRDFQDKIYDTRTMMTSYDAEFLVLTKLDEIAWLLNLRGSDIPYNPLFYAYMLINQKNSTIYVNKTLFSAEVEQFFEKNKNEITVKPYENAYKSIQSVLGGQTSKTWMDKDRSSAIMMRLVEEDRLVTLISPTCKFKLKKNDRELAASREAHTRDSIALCEFFMKMEKLAGENNGEAYNKYTEYEAALEIEAIRENKLYSDGPSFETIAASGPNAAIVHYAPTKEESRQLNVDEMFLLDSGGQYLDGTTDVTRTWHFGKPSFNETYMATKVLQGQIDLQMQHFPRGTSGDKLDVLARKPLYDIGKDYAHGTGHGVGMYLNVHEYPVGIGTSYTVGLEEGMFTSVEPGYYEDGQFGIRHENVVVVQNSTKFPDTHLMFDPLTLVPYQRKLIDETLLTNEEIQYINEYHSSIHKNLVEGGLLGENPDVRDWVVENTKPISSSFVQKLSIIFILISILI